MPGFENGTVYAGDGSGGDATFQAIISGGQTWSFGGDDSDADSFVISANAALGTTNTLKSESNGILTFPLQSSISAYLSADQVNATGNNTEASLFFNAEDWDIQSEHNAGIFLAKSPGMYLVIHSIHLGNLSSSHTSAEIKIYQNANIIKADRFNPYATQSYSACTFQTCTIAQMAAGDNITATVTVLGGTKTVTLAGGKSLTFVKICKIA